VFPFLQQHGNVDRDEMFRVFNMGIGYTIICRPAFSDAVCAKLAKLGESPSVIGEIVKGNGEVRV
jgi:phosphoribosylformylglycinamidine cyclo-ligase